MFRVAIVGDVHRQFSDFDVRYFNASGYDLILIVGDLSNYWHREGVRTAHIISGISKPALFIPGNHDSINLFQLIAEVRQMGKMVELVSLGQERRMGEIEEQIRPVTVCGYSVHPFRKNGDEFDVIAARPFSMGGDELGSRRYLRRMYDVESLDESAARLKKCVDRSEANQVIFLAHNGPSGLGRRRSDIWGCDFRETGGDFGDQDLRLAIDYAEKRWKRILAVIAGHMHRQLRDGATRTWHVKRRGVHYVNVARVPRIFSDHGTNFHHHISLEVEKSEVMVDDVYVKAV
jgi:uncharacterized protein (TIGR04168 family)